MKKKTQMKYKKKDRFLLIVYHKLQSCYYNVLTNHAYIGTMANLYHITY